jgi:NAD(P)-dependent dehydrogenase (short-subunit alcohol dehydrogenase family)
MSVDPQGRTVLVTGASSGLGAHFARMLAAAGARVVLAARRIDRLQSLVREIGDRAVAVAMDVTDEASVHAGFDAGETRFGMIDSVICNAGVGGAGPALETSDQALRETFDVNIRGVYLTAREGARRLIAAGKANRGRIVLIASVAGQAPISGLASYCASKAAVIMMGKCFAREWARAGINVNMICPGYIETEMNAAWFASTGGKQQIERFPRKRLIEPSDLDGALLYLLSDAARAVTGAVFTIDDAQIGAL